VRCRLFQSCLLYLQAALRRREGLSVELSLMIFLVQLPLPDAALSQPALRRIELFLRSVYRKGDMQVI
jgi:predicted membrane protein